MNSLLKKARELLARYIKERNWILVDCFIIWLHNESGGTARSRFPDLVLRGIIGDLNYNLRFNHSQHEIEIAINEFKNDLKKLGVNLLYNQCSLRDAMPFLADVMIKRMLEKTDSEEKRKILFLFAKYYASLATPPYGLLSSDIEKFRSGLKSLYTATFMEDLELSHPEDFLCKLGIVLWVDWVVSRRPESHKEYVVAKWADKFLREVENYISVTLPPIVNKIEEYVQLLDDKSMIPQLVFLDLLLERNLHGKTPIIKSETNIRDQLNSLLPGSYAKVHFKPGVCGRASGLVFLSPLVRDKLMNSIDHVKRRRMLPVANEIDYALKTFEKEPLFDVGEISDHPKILRIDSVTSSLSILAIPWCKPSDVRCAKDLSQKTNAVIIFVKDQKLPTLRRLFKDDPKILFCIVKENKVFYTSDENSVLKTILNKLAKDGYAIERIIPIEPKEPGIPEEYRIGYALINDFEAEMRRFLVQKLKLAYGEKWWKRGILKGIRDNCEKRRKDAIIEGEKEPLENYMDFSDYVQIIERRDNWKSIFKSAFRRKREVSVKLMELKEIRDRIMHRRHIEERDIVKARLYIEDLKRCMSCPSSL